MIGSGQRWAFFWFLAWAQAGGSGQEVQGRFEVSTEQEEAARGEREGWLEAGAAGWASEVFHERTAAVLKRLGEALVAGEPTREFLSPDGVMVGRGPLGEVLSSGGVRVERASEEEVEVGLEEGFLPLVELFAGGKGKAKFKQYGVSLEESGSGTTEVIFSGQVEKGGAVASERWVCQLWWDEAVRVVRVEVRERERVEREGEPAFVERTAEVLGGAGRFGNTSDWGANRMSERMLSESGRALLGISLGDANGDGRDDVFCPQGAGLPNLYFVSTAGGGFEEAGKEAGLDWLDRTASGLWVDFDNDGDQDLAVATSSMLVVMENEGDGRRFRRRASFAQQDSSALCAADYDGDGLVDLFVGNYMSDGSRSTVADPEAVYDAKGGGSNRLYRNGEGFSFSDVTEPAGLDAGGTRLTLAAGWEDFDNDGDVDLYVANDFGRNCLYRNEGGRFEEVAAELGADDPSTGMSVSWADVDLDGWMDVSVANMFSAAGNRVVPQAVFRERLPEALDVDRVGELARGNSLLLNRGGRFEERGAASGMGNTQWTWGLLMADLDNSTTPDLIAVNGFLTGPDEDDL